MNLREIQGSYDLVASLGSWCGPALHTKRHNLRKNSFPFDWVQSPFLSDVNKLLKNRFEGYMELGNMVEKEILAHFVDEGNTVFEQGGTEPAKAHFIHDSYYHIDSVHDFPRIPNQDWIVQYPSYKEKLKQRIERFFTHITQSQSILFIRYEWGKANDDEVVELQSILSQITKGKINILIMEPLDGLQGVKEVNWGLNGICLVQVPRQNPDDHAIWDEVLKGVILT
ncbi:hypothetical protein SRABI96_03452 [Peribacillus sp. Bi96]|uniref:DUF1796 family putative cysteine peptidase n=1 Tax=Peribacillus sp. Bi96 TaxID=2884273 RepID=UPI001E0E595D|nr:DUF1796 family putative cysteine peptidase [Peribacillus sp. Bi96]CAH0261944.1 hypothetical protein SRABI96_03452 [Peribacillus sp. Bi96]